MKIILSDVDVPSMLSTNEDCLEDLVITTMGSHKSLQLALTKCYVPWCEASRTSLTLTLECQPVPDDDHEDYGPEFFKVGGYRQDGSFDLISILYWRERIIMCRAIEIVEGQMNFRLANIYERTSKQHRCSHCSHDIYEWNLSVKSADVVVSLEQDAIAAIHEAYDHWDELFSKGEDGVLSLRGRTKIQSLGFEKIENKIYGRNWTGEDYDGSLSHVAQIWPFQRWDF